MTIAIDTPIYFSVLVDQARAEGARIVQAGLRLEVCWCGAAVGEPCRTRSGRGRHPHKGRS